MTSKQYEELCRLFIADQFKLDVYEVTSEHKASATLPENPDIKHQIDLYWETGNEVTKYINIANAKWRSEDKVDQGEMLLLKEVKQQLNAHKAVMMTNIGFTSGAIAVAKNAEISLHVVQPTFDYSKLEGKDAKAIQSQIQAIVASQKEPVYSFRVEHRALDTKPQSKPPIHQSSKPQPYQTRILTGRENRTINRPNKANRTIDRGFKPPTRRGNPFKTR